MFSNSQVMDSLTFAIACLLCIFGFSLQASGTYRVMMTPERYLQIDAFNTPQVNISCVLLDSASQPVALAGCEYRLYYKQYTMQFNEGPASPNYTYRDRWSNTTSKYHGRGLDKGECGITFGGYENDYMYILGCRVRPSTGVWQTAAMMLYADDYTPMQYHLEPQVVLAPAGTDVTLTGKAEHELDECWFFLPPADNRVWLNFNSGPASDNDSLARYHGAGLNNKECGITLLNVQPVRSGFVEGGVTSLSPVSVSLDFIELIVLAAPESPPLLTVLTPGVLQPGDLLEATCLVNNSRPAANISWYMGDVEVTQGISEDGPLDSKWRWNHDPQTVQKRLRLRILSGHDGQKLMCRAGHVALPSGFQNSALIHVRVNAPDPCTPNPCFGNHSLCHLAGQVAVCDCLPPFIGYPFCHLECVDDNNCRSLYRTCVASRCVDVCLPDTCGEGATCSVESLTAVCKCREGLVGDPHVLCKEEECGRREVNPAQIAGGQNANYGEFPWHAAIYRRTTRNNITSYELICGGTLIRADIVITAAHCVYDEAYQTVSPKENYGVALGKILSDWNVDMNNTDIQRMDLDDIHVHEDFRGFGYALRYDIAILKLSSSAVLTSQVNVACVDWSNKFDRVQLAAGNYGSVAGFGKSNASTASERLQWLDLPWVDDRTCRRDTDLRQRKYLAHDKFCAGYLDRGMSVCGGDSGGGILFLNATTNKFYLRGIVSTSLVYTTQKHTCESNHYTLFTKLSDFLRWVKTYVPAVDIR